MNVRVGKDNEQNMVLIRLVEARALAQRAEWGELYEVLSSINSVIQYMYDGEIDMEGCAV